MQDASNVLTIQALTTTQLYRIKMIIALTIMTSYAIVCCTKIKSSHEFKIETSVQPGAANKNKSMTFNNQRFVKLAFARICIYSSIDITRISKRVLRWP